MASGESGWSTLLRFKVSFETPAQEMKLFANGNMQVKVIVEIIAADSKGDPVKLTDKEMDQIWLIDGDNAEAAVAMLTEAAKTAPGELSVSPSLPDPADQWGAARLPKLGEGWDYRHPENRFRHSLSTASFFSSTGVTGDQIQQKIFWVSTTKVEEKKIVAVLVRPGQAGSELTMLTTADDAYQNSIICSGISPINYTESNLLCAKEKAATGKYEDHVSYKLNLSPAKTLDKDWNQTNYNIAPAPSVGSQIVQATFHWTKDGSNKELRLEQTPAALAEDWPEGSSFPLLPLVYAQHDNALHVFDLWSFLPPKEFQDFAGIPADKIAHDAASFEGPVVAGTEVKYSFLANDVWDPFESAGWHTLKSTATISGNGKSGAVCVSHVCFNDADSAQAYKDIDYLRENHAWVDFVDEYGNPGAFGIVISDDEVTVVSHRLE